ncbi:MAG: 6-carboxytetrahydropterin synthase QueD [Candidatus Omnitrophica bacterium]|nr:6-carboxytetrahydropterin synthase QueD [Candidatus Omnitrophota bacterium]
MYEIKVKANFSSAHNLRNYRGKCEHLHGHNWNVEAIFAYGKLDKDGMAMDFKDAKAVLKRAIEDMDHSYLNELESFKTMNPTSENIAKLIYGRIKKASAGIKSISVWENGNSCATYTEGPKSR